MTSPSETEQNPTPREPLSRRLLSTRLLPGTTVAGYVVGEPLGEGGMGQVYAAVDERLGRHVALKILAGDDDDSAEGRARFLREARALARVEHHNVVRVYASGEDNGVAWMALEVVHGDSLCALADNSPVDEETAVGLCAQVARGLAAVHRVGIIHRDVKPSNILVDDDAVVKLIDFGVAWLNDHHGGFTTRAGIVVGTPHFMSPEQARGAVVDASSDAWGLGATLYALLAGVPPFYGSDDEADLDILARVVRDTIADIRTIAPQTSSATASLLAALLNKEASARLCDLAAVADALDDIGAALARGAVPAVAVVAVVARGAVAAVVPVVPVVPVAPPAPFAVVAREGASVGAVVVGAVVVGAVVVVVAIVGGIVGGRYLFAPAPQIVAVPVEVPVEVPVAVPVKVSVEVKPVPVPPLVVAPLVVEAPPVLTAERTAAPFLKKQGEDLDVAITTLLQQTDDVSATALVLLVTGPETAGDVVIEQLRTVPRADADALIEAALFTPSVPRRRQLRAIDVLLERRNDTALALLMRAADRHGDAAVRKKATAARDSIFKVE